MPDAGDLSAHPDLGGVGAAMRSTWAAEQDAATNDAQEQRRHRQTLRDWLVDAMHAGDRIAVTIIDQRFTGTVEELGDDLLGLRPIFGRVDVHLSPGLPLHVELVNHPTEGGRRGRVDVPFAAAVAAREGPEMSVGTTLHPEGLDGDLTVGADFVTVRAKAGAVTVVPMAQIAWVSSRRT